MKDQHDADRSGKIAEATTLAMMLKAFHDLPKPVIARVQGKPLVVVLAYLLLPILLLPLIRRVCALRPNWD